MQKTSGTKRLKAQLNICMPLHSSTGICKIVFKIIATCFYILSNAMTFILFYVCVFSWSYSLPAVQYVALCFSAPHAEWCWGSKCYSISLTVIPYCNKSFWVCTRMQFVTVSVCKNIYELMWTLFTLHLWLHFWKCLNKYNKISWYILRYLNGPQDILQSKKSNKSTMAETSIRK